MCKREIKYALSARTGPYDHLDLDYSYGFLKYSSNFVDGVCLLTMWPEVAIFLLTYPTQTPVLLPSPA